MRLPSGTLLQGGKYKIITKIGQGGFGIVYKALHVGLQRDICIKEFFFNDYCERATNSTNVSVISTSAEKIQLVDTLRKKFTKEAQRLAQFQNPHIIQVMDNFEENNTAYFVMEYLEGGSLEDMIERDGLMSEEKAKKLILPLIDALEAVHNVGLLHLDIKPSNIMLRKNQSLVLIDFGISKYMETAQGNNTTAPIGISKGYAPLEQYGGTIANFSKATDVYSLCATLYKMVTCVTPPEPLQIIGSGIKSPKELNSRLTVKFSNLIISGLLTKATERPQTMGQLKSKLGSDKSNTETEVNSTTYSSNSNNSKTNINNGNPPRRNNYNSNQKNSSNSKPYWIIGGIILVAIIAILIYGSSGSPKPAEPAPAIDSVVVVDEKKPTIKADITGGITAGGIRDYPGGESKLEEYIEKNINYPLKTIEACKQGIVSVSFNISPEGKIVDIYINQYFDSECKDEIIRVLNEAPSYLPYDSNNPKDYDYIQKGFNVTFELK